MRFLAILCVIAAALTSSVAANAESKGKGAKGQDLGAIRDKCRAEAVGYGSNKAAQVRACVQRARGR